MDLSWKRHELDIEAYRKIMEDRKALREELPTVSQLMETWQLNPELIIEELISQDGVSESLNNVAALLATTKDVKKKLHIHSLITKIHLSRKRLKKIAPFGIMENLVVLDLSLNQLVVLENLDSLVKLEILDLGYNRIEKIQGLDALVNLRNLNLKNNRIKEIEGFDNSSKLETFNISSNKVHSRESITYLRKFEYLTRLNIENNPVCVNQDGDVFAKAMVPQVQCHNYHTVSDKQRRNALKIYENDVITERLNKLLQDREKQDNLKLLKEKTERSQIFVEKLEGDYLFMSQFDNDTDGQEILKLCKFKTKLGASVNDLFSDFKRDFMKVCNNLYEYGKDQYKTRRKEISEFESVYERQKLRAYEEFKSSMNTCKERKIEFTLNVTKVAHQIKIIKEEEKIHEEKEVVGNFFTSSTTDIITFQNIDNSIKEIMELILDFKKKNKQPILDQNTKEHDRKIAINTSRVSIGTNKKIGYLTTNNEELDKILQVLSSTRYNQTNLDYMESNEMMNQLNNPDTMESSIHSFKTCCLRDRNLLFKKPQPHRDQTTDVDEMKDALSFYSEMDEMSEQMFEDEMSDVSRDISMFEDYKEPKVIIECMVQRVKDEAERLFSEFDLASKELLRQEYRLHENLNGFSTTFIDNMDRFKMDFWIQIVINMDLLRKQATEFNEELGKLLRDFYKNVKNKKIYQKHRDLYRILSEEEAMDDALMNSFGEAMDVLWAQEDEITDKLFAYLESMETTIEEGETGRHHMMYTQVDNYFKSCKEDVEVALRKLGSFVEEYLHAQQIE